MKKDTPDSAHSRSSTENKSDNRVAADSSSDGDSVTAVLLGASNLTLAWPRLVPLLHERCGAPLQILTAHGMGRSYFLDRSGFAFRQLPGILHCDLWNVLREVTECRSVALITDIGNDLVYGQSPLMIVDAVRQCILRLRDWRSDCRIVLTSPPVSSVEALGAVRFYLFRSALFPLSRLTLDEVRSRTAELDLRLRQLADELQIPIAQPQPHWYGLDPIHVRRRFQTEAFERIFACWDIPAPAGRTSGTTPNSRPRGQRPQTARYWRFGREQTTPQPSVVTARHSVRSY
ncbi:MAG: hypothetical protein KDA89_07305 [Planctomycetaceae bacterium]|nr:hypothetical protein [Planctomycetaceae bacterium]